jgi:hypothetical protein
MCRDFAMPLPSHPGGVLSGKKNEQRRDCLRSVHEKAGQAEIHCGCFSKTADANQWEARRFQSLFPSPQLPNRHAPIRTLRGAIAPVPAGVINSTSKAISELHCLCLQKRAFLVDAAVARTPSSESIFARCEQQTNKQAGMLAPAKQSRPSA